MNNEKLYTIKPLIFSKKLNDKQRLIPLNTTFNTAGTERYFPPATKEWFNSVYAYNNNYIKGLSIADKNLSRLIKSYFNLYFNKTILKSKRIATRFRRLTLSSKVFISKAEVKHTSSKVIITLHIYNEEKRVLLSKIKRLEALLFTDVKYSFFKGNKDIPLSLKDKLNLVIHQDKNISFINSLEELKLAIVEEIKLNGDILIGSKTPKLTEGNLLNISSLEKSLKSLLNIIDVCENDPVNKKYYTKVYTEAIRKTHLEKEIMTIAYYKLLLNLNKLKFEDRFIFKLKSLVSKIYNKEVEFNVINIKTPILNSDIFTQAIALKLKNRDNKLLNVLRSSLYMVNLPRVNRIREQFNNKVKIKELWVNIVKNLKINSTLSNNSNNDNLDKLLLDLFPNSNFIGKANLNIPFSNKKVTVNTSLLNFVLNSLKDKDMGGIRLEAKGRLTRRFTASRSLFKIKWKGSLRNIDSSYRKLSTVMLRGHLKSNVQYSIVNSKTRNGSFGLKGWTSGK